MKKQSRKSSKTKTKATEPDKSKDSEQEFPGYPQYPASEDIMTRGRRLDVDVNSALDGNTNVNSPSGPDSPKLGRAGNKGSDLTKDDLQALPSDEIESTGDDEILQNRSWPVDFTGSDLDVPGSEEDDAQEQVGSEDEENNSYSLGSDRHSDLDEGRS